MNLTYLKKIEGLAYIAEKTLKENKELNYNGLNAIDFSRLVQREQSYISQKGIKVPQKHQFVIAELRKLLGSEPKEKDLQCLIMSNHKLNHLSNLIRPAPIANGFLSFCENNLTERGIGGESTRGSNTNPTTFYGYYIERALNEEIAFNPNSHFGRLAEEARGLDSQDIEYSLLNALTFAVAREAALFTAVNAHDCLSIDEAQNRIGRMAGHIRNRSLLKQYRKDLKGLQADIEKHCGNGINKHLRQNTFLILNRIRLAKNKKSSTELLKIIVQVLGLAFVGDKAKM